MPEVVEDGNPRYECPVCCASVSTNAALPGGDVCQACGSLLWCRRSPVGDTVVLEVMVGRTPTHAEIERLVESLVRSRDVPRMLVDLSSLDYISSALMARLITVNRRLNDAKGSLVLFGLSPFVRDLLIEMGLDGVFQIAEDEEAALATL